jgi:hypothetical protein
VGEKVKLIRLALARNLARSLNHEGCLTDWIQRPHFHKRWMSNKRLLGLRFLYVYRPLLPQKLTLYIALVFGSFCIVLFTFLSL